MSARGAPRARTHEIVAFLLLLAGCAREPAALVFDAPVLVAGGAHAQAEPAIAARGDLVVVSWIDWSPPRPLVYVAISTNGGASFGARVAAEEPAREHSDGQADPALAIGSDGVHLAWLACGRDDAGLSGRRCDVRRRKSVDGRAWSAPEAITDSPLYRERPWLIEREGAVIATWSEAGADGKWRWIFGDEMVADRSSVLRPSGGEALLVDRTKREPLAIHLEEHAGKRRWVVPRPAVLLDYSYGAIATDATGARWTALAIGDGLDCDLRVLSRKREAGRVRTPGATRVGLPWIEPAGGGRFVLAWIEERSGGWHVMARPLGPKMGPATEVGEAPFRFRTASLDLNIGDYLQGASSEGSVWIAWSDTHRGDADVYVSRTHVY